jgi:hypothetical protein
VAFSNFPYRNRKIAFPLLTYYAWSRPMIQLANTFCDQHRREVTIADFPNSPVKEFMLCTQIQSPGA